MDTSWIITLPDVGFTAQQIGFIVAFYIAMRVLEAILSLVKGAFIDDDDNEEGTLLQDIATTYKRFGVYPIWIKIALLIIAIMMISITLMLISLILSIYSIADPSWMKPAYAFLMLTSIAGIPIMAIFAIVAIVKAKRAKK